MTHKECYVSSFKTSKGKKVGAATLAKRWNISLERAQLTHGATTQNAVRTVLNDILSRRYPTNDRMLRYRRLTHILFTDTVIASIPSWHRQNKYAQVFATSFGWSRVYPMKTKGGAHKAFSALAHEVGVPSVIVMDGSKEQTLGEFKKKCNQAGCAIRQIEPDSPWQNACESEIRELKRGYGRSMVKRRVPHKLWDHCLEQESSK